MGGKQPLNSNSAGYKSESHRDQGAPPAASSRPDPELLNRKKHQKSCLLKQKLRRNIRVDCYLSNSSRKKHVVCSPILLLPRVSHAVFLNLSY